MIYWMALKDWQIKQAGQENVNYAGLEKYNIYISLDFVFWQIAFKL